MLDANVNTTYLVSVRIFGSDGSPSSSASPVFKVYDQATYTLQATINMAFRVDGIYTCTWQPAAVGYFDVCIDEPNIPRHFFTTLLVGNSDDGSLSTHILNLSNKGQDVSLGAGVGKITYTNTLTFQGNPLQNTEVRVFQAQTMTTSGGTKFTHILTGTMYAKTNTNSLGSFTLYLDPGYYVLQYIDPNDGFNTQYINYNTSTSTWTTSSTEINP